MQTLWLSTCLCLVVALPVSIRTASAQPAPIAKVNQAPNTFVQNNYEPDVAVNPANPSQIVAAYIKDFGQATLRVGVSISNDSGATWTDVTDLPSLGVNVNGDPSVAFDSGGNIYVGYLAYDSTAPFFQGYSAIAVARSMDGGITWQAAIVSRQQPSAAPPGPPSGVPGAPSGPIPFPGALLPPPGFPPNSPGPPTPTPPVSGPPTQPPQNPGPPANTPPIPTPAPGSPPGAILLPFEDKPWIAIDISPTSRFRNTVHVVWQRDRTNGLESDIFYSRGRFPNFSRPVQMSDPLPAGQNLHNGPTVAVAPANGEVFVAWLLANVVGMPVSGAQILFDRDQNGGAGPRPFGTDITAVASFTTPPRALNCPTSPSNCTPSCPDVFGTGCTTTCSGSPCTGTGMRMRPYPSLAVDPTTPTFGAQTLYIAYAADPDPIQCGDESDVFLIRSSDSGTTWTPQGGGVALNKQGGPGSDTTMNAQFHPRVAVSPSVCVPPNPPGRTCVQPGTVVVSWYDRRADLLNPDRDYEVFIAAIDPFSQAMAGAAFCASCGASAPFAATPIPEPTFLTVGEYLGLALDGLFYTVAWTDTRASPLPGGMNQSDISFRRDFIPLLVVE